MSFGETISFGLWHELADAITYFLQNNEKDKIKLKNFEMYYGGRVVHNNKK